MQIKELHSDSHDMVAFWELPKSLYKSDSPFFQLQEHINLTIAHKIFGVFLDGEMIARTVLYFNDYHRYRNEKVVVFGNYEALEKASDHLVDFISFLSDEAKAWGAEYLIGPMNGSSWEDYRLPAHIKQPFFLEPYHQPYYRSQLELAGLEEMEVYTSYKATQLENALGTFSEGLDSNPLFKRIHFRMIDFADFRQELEGLYPLMSAAFEQNLFYTKLSEKDFIKKFESYQSVVNKQFTLIAEDEEGVPRACFFCVDNHLSSEKQLVIKTIARDTNEEWKSLGQMIGYQIYKKAIKCGYTAIIHALMYQGGVSVNLSERYEGQPLNSYFLLGKKLI